MQEKKENPLKQALMDYHAKLERMSPEERAREEAICDAIAKKFLRLINDSLDDFEEPKAKK